MEKEAALKREYLRELVMTGREQALDASKPFYRTANFAPSGRYINRFLLGADPEFIFERGGARVDASSLEMHAGTFVGADQNGRLVEVRPQPSRSALRVVASIADSLRLLAQIYPASRGCEWKCGAYLQRDGIGGHIHFGRKRPERAKEVIALDALTSALMGLGVFPAAQQEARQAGDALGQHYGMPSDYRLQAHGYEYRTLPSWLDSPWQAFLALTCAKLAVFDPELVRPWAQGDEFTEAHLKNLLAYYKAADDDALLALRVLKLRGIPKHEGTDFKARWGVDNAGEVLKAAVLPKNISPQRDTLKAIRSWMLSPGVGLILAPATITWTPCNPPVQYQMLLSGFDARRNPGCAEAIWDVVAARELRVGVYATQSQRMQILLGRTLMQLCRVDTLKRLVKKFPQVQFNVDDGGNSIGLSVAMRRPQNIRLTRRILLSGLLPLWSAFGVQEGSFGHWKQAQEIESQAKQKFIGRVVWPSAVESS